MKTYYGFDDKYILFTVYLLLRTFKTTIKRNVKNLRLFSTPEEANEQTKNQYFLKIYYFLTLIEFFLQLSGAGLFKCLCSFSGHQAIKD